MARASKSKQPTSRSGKETLGQRIGRFRKERGYTQAELAEKMGTIQRLISDYERDRLRPNPDVIVKLTRALKVTADELLGLKGSKKNGGSPNLRILRRLNKIEELPPAEQKFLLKTIDTLLKASGKK